MSDVGKLYKEITDPLADFSGDDDLFGEFVGDDEYEMVLGDDDDYEMVLGDELDGDDESGQWLHRLDPRYWIATKRERKLIDAKHRKRRERKLTLERMKEQRGELRAGEQALEAARAAEAAAAEAAQTEAQLQAIEQQVSGDFIGAATKGRKKGAARAITAIRRARRKNRKVHSKARALARKIKAGHGLSRGEVAELKKVVKARQRLRRFKKALLSGEVSDALGIAPIQLPMQSPDTGIFASGAAYEQLPEQTPDRLAAAYSQLPEQTPDRLAAAYDQLPEQTPDRLASEDLVGELATEILGDDDLVGELATEILGDDELGQDWSSLVGAALGKKRWVHMAALAAAEPAKLPLYLRKHKIRLNPAQRGHLKNIAVLTKRAMAKKAAKKAAVSGDDELGSLKKWTAVAALPIAAATYGAYKVATKGGKLAWRGTKWAGRKISSPFRRKKVSATEKRRRARAARIKAAQKKRQAALARQRAAEAEAVEEQEAAAAEAEAAEAEAAAAEAEAAAQETSAEAEEADMPEETEDTSEGDFVGLGPQTPWQSPHLMEGDFVGEFVGDFVGAVMDPRAKKILIEAGKKTPVGAKIRAGARVYKAAKAGNPRARRAVANMQRKAKAGDAQAKRDLTAVKAGKIAVEAKRKALRKETRKKVREARRARVMATRTRAEAAMARPLIRMSRRRRLAQAARIERGAARGKPRAKAIVARSVARAKKGEPRGKAEVAALKLARRTRLAARTPREKRGVRRAQRLLRSAGRGNVRAIRKVRVIQAAAKGGNPNAKRAMARLKTAAHVEKTLKTGKVRVPPSRKERRLAARKAARDRYAAMAKKVAAGTASREEALAGAKAAKAIGDKKGAATLALASRGLPSSTVSIKKAAAVAAAVQQGDPRAIAVVTEARRRAEEGDPAGINAMGKLAAVQAVEAVKKGQPMPAPIAEATEIVQRAQAKDPEAIKIVENTTRQATAGVPAAVEAAAALTAAAAVTKAIAASPASQAQWNASARETLGRKVSDKPAVQAEVAELYAKVQQGTATPEEARRARELALDLGNTKLAAEISALAPPMPALDPRSSMPDQPLPPIRTWGQAILESLKALALATRDPLQNYREGLRSRQAPTVAAAPTPVPSKKG